MAQLLFRLASASIRQRLSVLVAWVGLVLIAITAAILWSGPTSNTLTIPGTDSQDANDLLTERFTEAAGSSAQLVVKAPAGSTLSDPEIAAELSEVLTAASELPDVVSVARPEDLGSVSQDGAVGIAQVSYSVPASEVPAKSVEEVLELAQDGGDDSLSVAIGGEVPAGATQEVGVTSELVGIAVALVVLLITFGSLIAAGMPLLTGLLGVIITYSAIYLTANVIDLPSTTSTLAVMIGLAVGIDYALFIVSRHREELAKGRTVEEAAALSTATAGGAVVFAGLSVVIAIAGLAVVGIPFLTAMGLAAAGGVLIAVILAITLTPALLVFAGRRVVQRRVRVAGPQQHDERPALSTRWASAVLRRPVASLLGSVVVLGVLSAPALGLRLGFPDDSSLPADNTRRIAFETIDESFGPGLNAPLTIAVDLSGASESALPTVVDRISSVPGIATMLEPLTNTNGDTAIVAALPTEGPASAATERTLAAIRGLATSIEADTGARIAVTGLTATNIDVSDALSDALVPFLMLVLGLMLVLLVLAFRSVIIALKAVIAILLSVAASFGVLVAVFQWGWLAGLIGVEESLPLIPFLPIIMFAILFGLSMDYEVFILSRVRERISAGDSAREATLHGLGVSAKVITAAALIMIAVFGSFVAQVDATIKMFGLGLATAVLLDATIVRMVFVPAALAVLGERAWRLSPRLDRLIPDLDIEGHRLSESLPVIDEHSAHGDTDESIAERPTADL
jgi:putative drug exporter of the RND superfamily